MSARPLLSPSSHRAADGTVLTRPLGLAAALAALVAAAATLLPLPAAAASESISGAGSSAAAPVYRIWATDYARSSGTTLAYDPVGSTAGMARIVKHEVDFGASDVIASAADIRKNDLVMFPSVITGVVPVVNLPHIGTVRLTGDVLARIFLGELKSWDAPEIAALNPNAKLPALPIKLVARADGSGTTYHFAEYLAKASPAWQKARGVASRYDWPEGVLAVKGSAAVSQAVQATPGALGYIDFNYVVDDHLAGVSVRNADGEYVTAGVESFREAVMHSGWYTDGDFSQSLADRPGKGSWPLTMGTYVAVPRVAASRDRAERALRFVLWGYLHGDALARQAKFVPLPEKVQASAYREIARVTDTAGTPIGLQLMGSALR